MGTAYPEWLPTWVALSKTSAKWVYVEVIDSDMPADGNKSDTGNESNGTASTGPSPAKANNPTSNGNKENVLPSRRGRLSGADLQTFHMNISADSATRQAKDIEVRKEMAATLANAITSATEVVATRLGGIEALLLRLAGSE